jgi:hypothetical protein
LTDAFGANFNHRRFFFLFRSLGAIHPLFFVRIIGPPGEPIPARFPDIMLFISFIFPSIPIPPTARIMSRAVVYLLMKALTSCV